MDRMIAILGALLEENDAGSRPTAHEFRVPGEYTDMEISRVGVYSAVCQWHQPLSPPAIYFTL